MPDVWNADEATLFEILRPYGLGFSAALRDELENGEIPLACDAWFVSEKNQKGILTAGSFSSALMMARKAYFFIEAITCMAMRDYVLRANR